MATKRRPAMKSSKKYSGGKRTSTAGSSRVAPKKTAKTAPGRTAKKTTKKTSNWSWSSSKKKGVPLYKGKNKAGNKAGGKNSGKPQKPKFPSINDYLMGDEYYQYGLSDLDWALEQFNLENEAAQGDASADFASAMDYMNLDKERSLEFMKDDYGARGMVFSGLYPKAVSDYNEEWSMGAADLNRDLASQMRDLGFERDNMTQQTEMQKRDLRLDAIRRRADDIQAKQFNYKSKLADWRSGNKKSTKKSAKKSAPTKKTTSKSGVRKSGVRKLRKR